MGQRDRPIYTRGNGWEWVGMGRFVRELREWVRECRFPFVPSFGGNGWGMGQIFVRELPNTCGNGWEWVVS